MSCDMTRAILEARLSARLRLADTPVPRAYGIRRAFIFSVFDARTRDP